MSERFKSSLHLCVTAQRRDIQDPDVIFQFASKSKREPFTLIYSVSLLLIFVQQTVAYGIVGSKAYCVNYFSYGQSIT